MKNGFVAVAVATALASTSLMAQSVTINGTAKDEAKKPFTDFTVRARDINQGQIAGTSPLDSEGAFTLPNLASGKYAVELVNKDGKVVCTEGPFDMTTEAQRSGVVIDCNKVPAAWWIVGAAAAAGITAGVVTTGSPSR